MIILLLSNISSTSSTMTAVAVINIIFAAVSDLCSTETFPSKPTQMH